MVMIQAEEKSGVVEMIMIDGVKRLETIYLAAT